MIVGPDHTAGFPPVTLRQIHLRKAHALGVGNGFPGFHGCDNADHIDDRPAHQPEPESEKGFSVDLRKLVFFQHDDKTAEKHTPNQRKDK